MTKLQELYETREKLQSLGIEPNADLEKQLAALEEEIIKNEIVPKLKEAVEPTLQPVKRDLVFVVEYSPKEGVHVQLSRKRTEISTTALQEKAAMHFDNLQNEKDDEETKVITRSNLNGKGPKKGLIVTFADGTVINEPTAIETLINSAMKMGIKEVEKLCANTTVAVLNPAGIKLFTKTLEHSRQRHIGNGHYVFSCTNTEQKKQQIEYLAKALGVKLKVEII